MTSFSAVCRRASGRRVPLSLCFPCLFLEKKITKSDRKGKAKQSNSHTNTKGSRSSKKNSPPGAAKKRSKKKRDLSGEHMKYVTSLCGFGLVGYLLRKSWLAQLVFTSTFWVYLYWFSMRFETSSRKPPAFKL